MEFLPIICFIAGCTIFICSPLALLGEDTIKKMFVWMISGIFIFAFGILLIYKTPKSNFNSVPEKKDDKVWIREGNMFFIENPPRYKQVSRKEYEERMRYLHGGGWMGKK